jgi:hypothetical protein
VGDKVGVLVTSTASGVALGFPAHPTNPTTRQISSVPDRRNIENSFHPKSQQILQQEVPTSPQIEAGITL